MPKRPVDTAERFWPKVTKTDGCWLWTGCIAASGYGYILHRGRVRLAHRVALEISHGANLEGRVVCHHCDNPRCVRPDHLFIGSHADNVADKMQKGRYRGAALRKQCSLGHSLTAENVIVVQGRYRRCKTCNQQRSRAWRDGKRWNPAKGKKGGYE